MRQFLKPGKGHKSRFSPIHSMPDEPIVSKRRAKPYFAQLSTAKNFSTSVIVCVTV
jgi:hypothetical protein